MKAVHGARLKETIMNHVKEKGTATLEAMRISRDRRSMFYHRWIERCDPDRMDRLVATHSKQPWVYDRRRHMQVRGRDGVLLRARCMLSGLNLAVDSLEKFVKTIEESGSMDSIADHFVQLPVRCEIGCEMIEIFDGEKVCENLEFEDPSLCWFHYNAQTFNQAVRALLDNYELTEKLRRLIARDVRDAEPSGGVLWGQFVRKDYGQCLLEHFFV